jgi:hypothetical protein
MAIKVHNKTNSSIGISINHWGDSGKTGFYTVSGDSVESWSRSDSRGFVMFLREGAMSGPYYVKADSTVTIHSNRVDNAVRV